MPAWRHLHSRFSALIHLCYRKTHTISAAQLEGGACGTIKIVNTNECIDYTTRQLESLHTYRALLRECTYLPDSAARSYLPKYIKWRYRSSIEYQTSRSAQAASRRNQERHDHAKKELRFLERANAGHLKHLTKVLEIAYGRARRRRYELMSGINVGSSAMLACETSEDYVRVAPALMALLSSQAATKDNVEPRGWLLRLQPMIPEKNSWGRKMPISRVNNLKKKWYAEVLQRVHPPLPRAEWERLKKLAQGDLEWEGRVPRRSCGHREHVPQQGGTTDTCDIAELGVSCDKARRGLQPQAQVAAKPHMTESGISRPHTLTPRFMRRLYNRILVQCPMLEYDDGKWKVTWEDVYGQSLMETKSGYKPKPNVMLPAYGSGIRKAGGGIERNCGFDGVDHAGKRLEAA